MQYTVKFIGGVLILTLVICTGIFLYARRTHQRFTESLSTPPQKVVKTDIPVEQPSPVVTTISPQTAFEPDNAGTESAAVEYEETEKPDEASLEEFLALLDRLEIEELAEIAEVLDIKDADGNPLADLLQEPASDSSEVRPSVDVFELIESGVASLADLIDLMDAALEVVPEIRREAHQSLLESLRTLHATGGGVMVGSTPSGGKFLLLMPPTLMSQISNKNSKPVLMFDSPRSLPQEGTIMRVETHSPSGGKTIEPSEILEVEDGIEIKEENIIK